MYALVFDDGLEVRLIGPFYTSEDAQEYANFIGVPAEVAAIRKLETPVWEKP